MKFRAKIEQEVEAKVIEVHVKVCDSGLYTLKSEQGLEIHSRDGYVPEFFPEDHYGDYLDLKIDIETGQILNWKKPTPAQLAAFVGSGEDD